MKQLENGINFNLLTEKQILNKLTLIFEEIIKNNKEDEIESYLRQLSEPLSKYNISNPVPQHFFFVWLGILQTHAKRYPKVWLKSKVTPTFYYDSNAYLAGFYLAEFKKIAETRKIDIIDVQNDFYEFFNEISDGCKLSFDEKFLEYLSLNGINKSEYYKGMISKYIFEISIDSDFEFVDINNIENLFFDEQFKTYYIYEIVLRNNLAAASDIVRLLLLYKFGGVYVDLDTLPCFECVFKNTNQLLSNINNVNKNIVDVIKTEELLSSIVQEHKRSYDKTDKEILETYMNYLSHIDDKIYSTILNDISMWDRKLIKYEFPKVHKNLMRMSASKNNIFEFNNNMLASQPSSKMIRVILRQLKKRYNYSERRGFILTELVDKNIDINPYYERFKRYRFDGLNSSNNVTLILSGPSFILEVILGVSYQLLSIKYDIDPLAISYALREKNIGIPIEEQTMFTLEHIKSSWM